MLRKTLSLLGLVTCAVVAFAQEAPMPGHERADQGPYPVLVTVYNTSPDSLGNSFSGSRVIEDRLVWRLELEDADCGSWIRLNAARRNTHRPSRFIVDPASYESDDVCVSDGISAAVIVLELFTQITK